jgi:hypothetical protein
VTKNVLATGWSWERVGNTGKPSTFYVAYSWLLKLYIELWLRKPKDRNVLKFFWHFSIYCIHHLQGEGSGRNREETYLHIRQLYRLWQKRAWHLCPLAQPSKPPPLFLLWDLCMGATSSSCLIHPEGGSCGAFWNIRARSLHDATKTWKWNCNMATIWYKFEPNNKFQV